MIGLCIVFPIETNRKLVLNSKVEKGREGFQPCKPLKTCIDKLGDRARALKYGLIRMSVMIRITNKILRFPFTLRTPSGRPFKITHINGEKVLIETGKKPTTLKIPASALDEAPDFLRGKGWIRIGAVHEISDEPSLDTFLKDFSHGTSLASYVAPLLELAEIAEIDRNRPAKIRLRASH